MNKLTISLLLFFSLVSCTGDQIMTPELLDTPSHVTILDSYEILDGGFISDEPCGPPCFLGITSEDDIESATDKLIMLGAYTGDCEVESYDNFNVIECGNYRIFFSSTGNRIVIGATFYPTGITLAEVIEKFGEPDEVWVEFPVEFDTWFGYSYMGICYSEFNAEIFTEQQKPNDYFYETSPITKVFEIKYNYDTEFDCGGLDAMEWHGYGIYENP